MPTRILQIQRKFRKMREHLRVRLYIPKAGEYKEYAALSYCWGGDQPLVTTKESLNQRFHRIALDDLPRTILDGVFTCEQLGIEFLWVDSLCIIQDDEDDKAHEIALMPSLFQNSSITFTASSAQNVYEGFLNRRVVTNFPDLVFEIPYRNHKGDLGSIVLYKLAIEEKSEPLDTRGWALQERFLSFRILDFNSHQVRFLCPGMDRCDGWTTRNLPKNNFNLVTLKAFEGDKDEWRSQLQSLHYSNPIQRWHQIVQEYSDRNLSKSEDRILAISGIATLFGKYFRDQYVAGLWRFALEVELLWSRKALTNELEPDMHPHYCRPKRYQGPSWSWTAINGPVWFLGNPRNNDHFCLRDMHCHVCLASPRAPYGTVHSGELHVTGRLRTAWWTPNVGPGKDFPDNLQLDNIDMSKKTCMRMIPDAIEDERGGTGLQALPVTLLEVSYTGEDGYGHEFKGPKGLVLWDLGNLRYSRLGVFECHRRFVKAPEYNIFEENRRWFDDCQTKRIVII
jgi:hypothetical protein